jgi:hypothetical protein
MNNEQKIKNLIKEFLNTWETPESVQDNDSNEKEAMSPEEVAQVLNAAMGGRHASGRKMHPAFVKKN